MATYGRIVDPISGLPLELAACILELLDLEDLFTFSTVCTSWRSLLRSDYPYVSHLLKKYDLITYGRDPIKTNAHTNIAQQILQKYSRLSATPYFANATTLRDLAFQDLRLNRQWKSGVPTRQTDLNACLIHRESVLSVVIDTRYRLVISGDKSGKVVFWSTETGINQPVKVHKTTHRPAEISAMALNENHLAIGTSTSMVHIFRRDPEDMPIGSRAFSNVIDFQVPSPVASMIFEGNVCIVGCSSGEVMFYDIGVPENDSDIYQPKDLLLVQIPNYQHIDAEGNNDGNNIIDERNFFLHYQKPFLFTTSSVIEHSSPQRVDRDNQRNLWEYDDKIVIKTYIPEMPSEPEHEGRPCVIHPIGESDLLVAWPDTSVYRMGKFRTGRLQVPACKELVSRDFHRAPVGVLAANDRFFITSTTSAPNKITLFSEDGKEIYKGFQQRIGGPSSINDLKMDPCFFVSVSDRSVVLWDFTPRRLQPLEEFADDSSTVSNRSSIYRITPEAVEAYSSPLSSVHSSQENSPSR